MDILCLREEEAAGKHEILSALFGNPRALIFIPRQEGKGVMN
jgi:hypothetical protein